MKRYLTAALCAALAVCLCACGGPKAAKPDDYDYTLTHQENGTYTIRVLADDGSDLYLRDRMTAEPQCLALTKDILQLVGDNTDGGKWTVFCNVAEDTVSNAFGNYLIANETKVAYIDYLTDAYQLFVRDIYDESAYLEVTTLTGLVVQEDGALVKKATVRNNQLIVTYETVSGDTTITVAMPK